MKDVPTAHAPSPPPPPHVRSASHPVSILVWLCGPVLHSV